LKKNHQQALIYAKKLLKSVWVHKENTVGFRNKNNFENRQQIKDKKWNFKHI